VRNVIRSAFLVVEYDAKALHVGIVSSGILPLSLSQPTGKTVFMWLIGSLVVNVLVVYEPKVPHNTLRKPAKPLSGHGH